MGLFLPTSKDNVANDYLFATFFVADFEHAGYFYAAGVVN
jgi:hypothetical protein